MRLLTGTSDGTLPLAWLAGWLAPAACSAAPPLAAGRCMHPCATLRCIACSIPSPLPPPPPVQACLSTSAKPGAKAALKVKVGEGAALLVCALREGATESTGLDLIFDE